MWKNLDSTVLWIWKLVLREILVGSSSLSKNCQKLLLVFTEIVAEGVWRVGKCSNKCAAAHTQVVDLYLFFQPSKINAFTLQSIQYCHPLGNKHNKEVNCLSLLLSRRSTSVFFLLHFIRQLFSIQFLISLQSVCTLFLKKISFAHSSQWFCLYSVTLGD